MLRKEAISFLNEIATTYSGLLGDLAHISLHMAAGDTRVIIKSKLDFEQKSALLEVLKDKSFTVADISSDFETMLIIS